MPQKDPRLYDKLATKKLIKKYIIIMLCLSPILIALNLTVFSNLSSTLRIFLDVVIMLALLFVIDGIIKNININKNKTKENEDE